MDPGALGFLLTQEYRYPFAGEVVVRKLSPSRNSVQFGPSSSAQSSEVIIKIDDVGVFWSFMVWLIITPKVIGIAATKNPRIMYCLMFGLVLNLLHKYQEIMELI